MLFKTVKSVEDKQKLISEFLKNRKILKQRLVEKKLGDEALQEASKKIYQPVTKSVEKMKESTDKKQDIMIDQLKENQENITGAIDTLSDAISKQGSTGVESWLGKIPSQFDASDLNPIPEEAAEEEGAVGGVTLNLISQTLTV